MLIAALGCGSGTPHLACNGTFTARVSRPTVPRDGGTMRKRFRFILLAVVYLLVAAAVSSADDRLNLTGRVLDTHGKPVEHATVLVYHAGVKKGYNLYCPSCYRDCGKRAITDGNGMFTIKGLSAELWFQLLVALDGYQPTFVNKVDPAPGVPVAATLKRRKPASNPSGLFRGRIKDSRGLPVRDAIVEPVGILLDGKTGASRYGTIEGLEPVAISNQKGEFEIAYSKPGTKILVSVEARGLASRFAVIPAGPEHHLITVNDGALVRGRLVEDGKPVGNAEVGLIGRPRGGYGNNLHLSGYAYEEIRIGTQPDGRFLIPNVPIPADWNVYGKMESLATRGATGVVKCSTKHDAEIVDIGDIQIKPAYRLRGKVMLSDGKPIPDGMRVNISSESAWDDQTTTLPPDGHFEFLGLAAGDYSVFASVKGYSLPKAPVSVTKKGDDGSTQTITYAPGIAPPFSLGHDIEGYVIKLDPEK
jgi:Carboxypeptidase regulatory-like domain